MSVIEDTNISLPSELTAGAVAAGDSVRGAVTQLDTIEMNSPHLFGKDEAFRNVSVADTRLAPSRAVTRFVLRLSSQKAQLAFDQYKVRSYIPALDGIRAISVLLVITAHVQDRIWLRLNGNLGVVIFFVLSGYLITMLALREEQSNGALNLAGFYIRRTFRIFPLYYIVFAMYAVLILGLKVSPHKINGFVHALPYYLFYCQEMLTYSGSEFPFYQSWSLGIEEKFYLVWPVLAFGLLRRTKWPRLSVTLSMIVLFIFGSSWTNMIGTYRFEDYACILLGALLALFLEDRKAYLLLQRFGHVSFLIVLVSLAALHFFFLPTHQSYYGKPLYASLVTILLGTLLSADGLIQRLLANAVLRFIGRISYGVYLVHVLCFNVVERFFRPQSGLGFPVYLFTCLLSLAAAYILHILIERPMIGIGKWVLHRTSARSRPPAIA